jgi:catechol 2,3-dioxygenase-like lactoylglutathione lyase family enzyme
VPGSASFTGVYAVASRMLSKARVHASLPAADLARARAFYEEKLGVSPSRETPWALIYELEGGTGFSVFPTPNTARGGHTQMGFTVADAHETVAELKDRGVEFEDYDSPGLKTVDGVAEMDGHRSAWFKDSEGNIIELLEVE